MDNRGIYTIRSRNLVVGVYDADRDYFIGIREKFGVTYLDAEVMNRPPEKLGTVTLVGKRVGTLPDAVELTRGWWADTYTPNAPLYDLLVPLTEAELGRPLDRRNEED